MACCASFMLACAYSMLHIAAFVLSAKGGGYPIHCISLDDDANHDMCIMDMAGFRGCGEAPYDGRDDWFYVTYWDEWSTKSTGCNGRGERIMCAIRRSTCKGLLEERGIPPRGDPTPEDSDKHLKSLIEEYRRRKIADVKMDEKFLDVTLKHIM
jgi:hypothetical protein